MMMGGRAGTINGTTQFSDSLLSIGGLYSQGATSHAMLNFPPPSSLLPGSSFLSSTTTSLRCAEQAAHEQLLLEQNRISFLMAREAGGYPSDHLASSRLSLLHGNQNMLPSVGGNPLQYSAKMLPSVGGDPLPDSAFSSSFSTPTHIPNALPPVPSAQTSSSSVMMDDYLLRNNNMMALSQRPGGN
jgi:hypothetical protein